MSRKDAQHRSPCMNRSPHLAGEACGYVRLEDIAGTASGDATRAAVLNANRPCCPCFAGPRIGCLCSCHGPVSVSVGIQGLGVAQQLKAPGKLFARSDILAVVRGQKGLATDFHAREALDALARIIENME